MSKTAEEYNKEFDSMYGGHTPDLPASKGAKHKESLQVQETCKENQDSFTDEPKEMSVDEAMKYIDEKIAKTRASKSWEGVDVDKFMDEIRGRETDDLEKVVMIDNVIMNMAAEGYNNGYKTRPFYEEVLRRLNAKKRINHDTGRSNRKS